MMWLVLFCVTYLVVLLCNSLVAVGYVPPSAELAAVTAGFMFIAPAIFMFIAMTIGFAMGEIRKERGNVRKSST